MKALKRVRMWLGHMQRIVPLAACAALMLMGSERCNAQATADAKSVEGKVIKMTTAPKGEVDGATLDNGTVLHWPPHLQSNFAKVVVEGERVKASGRTESDPKGDVHFEVETVTNIRSNTSVTNPDFADGPRPRHGGPKGRGRRGPPPLAHEAADRGGRRAEMETVNGKVDRLTTAPRGEVDGAVLVDGTWIHWPPHLQQRFTAIVKVGDDVRATGQMETGPKGETHFEIQSLINIRSNQTAENPDLRPSTRSPEARQEEPEVGRRLRDLERQVDDLRRQVERLTRKD